MRALFIYFYYLMFIIFWSLLGLLFEIHNGLFYGLAFALIIMFVYFKYGEKIVLVLARARYVSDDESLIYQIKNFSLHVGVKDVKIYWSNVYVNNVYFVRSHLGSPSIIIGKNVFKSLNKNELNSLIYATLLRVRGNESKYRTTINLITATYFSWVFLIVSRFKNETIKNMCRVFLIPAFYLKRKFYKKSNDTEYFDQRVFTHDFLKRDYISALFKINKLKMIDSFSLGSFILSGLSHTNNESSDILLASIIEGEQTIEERIRSISGQLK